jgi:hypothetical protein
MLRLTRPVTLMLAGLMVAGATVAASAAPKPKEVELKAVFRGTSTHFSTDKPGKDRLVLLLSALKSNLGLRELRVDKFIDFTIDPLPLNNRENALSLDAVYTFTASNGDKLILNAFGYTSDLDATHSIAEEIFQVVGGTGRFEGATGAGRISSDVVIRPTFNVDDDIPDSDVTKTISGEIVLQR